MELNEAKEIVRALANGIDPTTGEVLPETSPYSNPKIIRALFALLEPTATEKKPKRSVDEKQRENEQLGKPRNAGLPWTDEQREQLATLFRQGTSLDEMAHRLARTRGAIVSELVKQGLIEADQAENGH